MLPVYSTLGNPGWLAVYKTELMFIIREKNLTHSTCLMKLLCSRYNQGLNGGTYIIRIGLKLILTVTTMA